MNRPTVAASAMLLSFAAHANPLPKPLQVEAELGLLLTSGNTNSSALNGRLDIKQELANWRNNYVAQGLYKKDETRQASEGSAREQSRVTAERYFLSAQADYKLDKDNRGLFVFASFEENKFSGYDYQGALAAGYSDRLFRTPYAYLDYSVGPGLSFNRTDESIGSTGNLIDNQNDTSAILRVSAFYQYEFNNNAKFEQSLASDVALESRANTRSKSVTAVTANINEAFALKASLTVNHNSEVPVLRENTDSTVAMSLVYSF